MRIERKEDIYILHQGAYFRGFISTMSGFFILMLSFAFLYISFKDAITDGIQKLLTLFTLVLVIIVLINIFRGKEGIEFDLKHKMYRKFVIRAWMKFGKWKSLEPYTMLCLTAQYNSISRGPNLAGGRHRSLEINLASLDKKPLLLVECKNYKDGEYWLERLNNFLNMEIKNFVKQEYTKPSPRR